MTLGPGGVGVDADDGLVPVKYLAGAHEEGSVPAGGDDHVGPPDQLVRVLLVPLDDPGLQPRPLQRLHHGHLQRLVDVVVVADGGVVAAPRRQLLLQLLLGEGVVAELLELVAGHLGEDDRLLRPELAGVVVAEGGAGAAQARQPGPQRSGAQTRHLSHLQVILRKIRFVSSPVMFIIKY